MIVISSQGPAGAVENDVTLNPDFRAVRHVPVVVPHHLAHAASALATSGFDRAAVLVVDGLALPSPTAALRPAATSLARPTTAGNTPRCSSRTGAKIRSCTSTRWPAGAGCTSTPMACGATPPWGGCSRRSPSRSSATRRRRGDGPGRGRRADHPRDPVRRLRGRRVVFPNLVQRRFPFTERWPAHEEAYAVLAASGRGGPGGSRGPVGEPASCSSPARSGSAMPAASPSTAWPMSACCGAAGSGSLRGPCSRGQRRRARRGVIWLWQLTGSNRAGSSAPTPPVDLPSGGDRSRHYRAPPQSGSHPPRTCSTRSGPPPLRRKNRRLVPTGGSESAREPWAIAASCATARRRRRQGDPQRRVKHRQRFRPFAPAVLREEASDWFDFDGTPTKARSCCVRPVPRDGARVPAVVHVDGTGRCRR